jgi:tRNA 2-thiocytidine biosynthesis protein TtcA
VRLTKQEGRNRIQEGLVRIKRIKERYGFLEKHSRILVGVSGGVDSSVLYALLHEYNERYSQRWHIHACFVDSNVYDDIRDRVISLLKTYGNDYTIVSARISRSRSKNVSTCYLCARQRRKRLLEVAEHMNIQQIALAHHTQDVAETLLLNMMYNGEISTLVPKQSVIQGRHFFIRPLYEFQKREIETIARLYSMQVITNECPYFRESKRNSVRTYLETCKKHNPDVYKNIFRAVRHIKRTYLP